MIVNELVTRFSFLGSLKPQESFNANLGASIKLTGAMVGALKTLSIGFHALMLAQLQSIAPVVKLKNETGIASARIEQLGYIATATGGSVEGMSSTLDSLNQKLGDAALNGNDTFSRLGINIRTATGEVRKADDVLLDVQRRFSQMKLSRQEKQSFANSLGIDDSLIKFLNLSQAEYAKYNEQAKRALFLTDAQTEAAEKHNISLELTRITMQGLRNQVAVNFAPMLTKLNNWFIDLLSNNREWIIKGITKTGEALAKVSEMIVRLLPLIVAVGAAFAGYKLIALAPILLITLALTAALLVIDDIIVAFKGGKSVIRDFFQEFLGIDITPILRDIWDTVNKPMELFIKLFKEVKALITGGGFTGLSEMFLDISKTLLPDWYLNALPDSNPAQTTMQLPTGVGATENKTVTQTNNITVISSDPAMAGRMTADRLQDQLNNADAVIGRGGI